MSLSGIPEAVNVGFAAGEIGVEQKSVTVLGSE